MALRGLLKISDEKLIRWLAQDQPSKSYWPDNWAETLKQKGPDALPDFLIVDIGFDRFVWPVVPEQCQ